VDLTLRRAGAADFDALIQHDQRGFGTTHSEAWTAAMRRMLDLEKFLLVEDGDEVVGVTGSVPFPMGVPGGQVPIEGVTWVSVLPTHRRRGILRILMEAQIESLTTPFAALTASQGTLYGRYGYGPATEHRRIRIDKRFARFRPEAPNPGGVRMITAAEARTHAPEVHARWAVGTPGSVLRDPVLWDFFLDDPDDERRGGTALFHLAHPDGYASYRVHHDRGARVVQDLFAATPEAHAALWRVLLEDDFVTHLETSKSPPGDALGFLLTDPRVLETTEQEDAVWVRILDVPAALSARTYAVDVDLVLEVDGVRYRLHGGPQGAECAPTSANPHVRIGLSALGSVYLGGHRVRTLARAGLVAGPGVSPMDAAFVADRPPVHGTGF
jgi:predicted acetyltransferase